MVHPWTLWTLGLVTLGMEPQWARSGSGSRVWVFYSKRGLLKNNNWEVSTTKASAVDNEDNLILDHDRITKVWHDFLYNKFAVTETDHARDACICRPGTSTGGRPTNRKQRPLCEHYKNSKRVACVVQTASGIPGEVFANCESATRELYNLLSTIWS